MYVQIPVSPGELIDKITILEIKTAEISDPSKLANIGKELLLLQEVVRTQLAESEALTALHSKLRDINKKIWDTENDVREFWNDDAKFLAAARGSHFENDARARVKKEINELLGSSIMEEKSHPTYEHKV